ncbi:MAG: hypothetical protein ACI8RD_012738, partial [Bacillariaceae sp.]
AQKYPRSIDNVRYTYTYTVELSNRNKCSDHKNCKRKKNKHKVAQAAILIHTKDLGPFSSCVF